MRYIIYGAGADGKKAFEMLGGQRVSYFCDSEKCGEYIFERPVISFEKMLIKYKENCSIIVIASSRYQLEMELALQMNNVVHYFVFSENSWGIIEKKFPRYWLYNSYEKMNYTNILSYKKINRFQHIAISNINVALPVLISEIAFQCNSWRIDYILTEDGASDSAYMGIPIVKLEAIKDKIDCLIINEKRSCSSIRDKLPSGYNFEVVDVYDIKDYIPDYYHPELSKYKNIHNGKRCFIVGNGPSLRIEDLNTLDENNEISFGVNAIYKVFSLTSWRPTYYCASDEMDIPLAEKYLGRNGCKFTKFYSDAYNAGSYTGKQIVEGNIIHLEIENQANDQCMPAFSNDITHGTYSGYTVLYDICLQLAAYMGFKEIYLIGVDFDFLSGEDTQADGNHFIFDYVSQTDREFISEYFINRRADVNIRPDVWKAYVVQSYKKAELYSRVNNFRIYNATRGGKLDVFERVNFDEVLRC